MKLNYRDRIILLVLIGVVILIAGFFGLIKPKYKDIKSNTDQRDTVQAEWDGLDEKIQQIPELEKDIKAIKADADKLSANFYTGNDIAEGTLSGFIEPYQVDKFMQEVIDKSNVKIMNLEVGKLSDAQLSYYCYTPVVPVTAILDLADLNNNYSMEILKKMAESTALALRPKENLYVQQYGVNVKATKENLWKFMEEINNLNKSINIESVQIMDTDFGVDFETGKMKENVETQKDSSGKDVGVTTATIVINIYSVYNLDEPNFN